MTSTVSYGPGVTRTAGQQAADIAIADVLAKCGAIKAAAGTPFPTGMPINQLWRNLAGISIPIEKREPSWIERQNSTGFQHLPWYSYGGMAPSTLTNYAGWPGIEEYIDLLGNTDGGPAWLRVPGGQAHAGCTLDIHGAEQLSDWKAWVTLDYLKLYFPSKVANGLPVGPWDTPIA
jgi:hypothetical protein